MDAVGSAIRVDARGREVLRILPRNNDAVNEEWISDKTRFVADGLRTQRLDRPYVRKNGRLEPASWDEALALVAARLKAAKPERIGGHRRRSRGRRGDVRAQQTCSCASARATSTAGRTAPSSTRGCGRASYLFNSAIEGIEQADAVLLIGTNPRLEAAVLNARIRKRWRQGNAAIGLIGERADLTYPYDYLGAGPQTLKDVADGKHSFAATLREAKNPMVIVGAAAAARPDGAARAGARRRHRAGGRAGQGRRLERVQRPAHRGFARGGARSRLRARRRRARRSRDAGSGGSGSSMSSTCSAPTRSTCSALGKAFVVYQGSHGDAGAQRADVILPGAAYTEKSATYVNTEGRAQMTSRAAFPPGDAKEDWAIMRALSAHVGHTLPYDSLSALRAAMYKEAPALARLDAVGPADWAGVEALAARGGALGARAVRRDGARFLSHQSDRAGLRCHGRAQRAEESRPAGDDRNAWLAPGLGPRSGKPICGRCW